MIIIDVVIGWFQERLFEWSLVLWYGRFIIPIIIMHFVVSLKGVIPEDYRMLYSITVTQIVTTIGIMLYGVLVLVTYNLGWEEAEAFAFGYGLFSWPHILFFIPLIIWARRIRYHNLMSMRITLMAYYLISVLNYMFMLFLSRPLKDFISPIVYLGVFVFGGYCAYGIKNGKPIEIFIDGIEIIKDEK